MAPRLAIESLPEPAKKTPMKFVCMSTSRTGTLGLYQAFKLLGYRPYHMIECAAVYGGPHLQVFDEALVAEHNHLSGLARLDRAGFDRWLAAGEHDVLIELGSYFPESTLAAYLSDPNVRFLLTERDPDRWAQSIDKFVGGIIRTISSFPLPILAHFNVEIRTFLVANVHAFAAFSGGRSATDLDRFERLRVQYVDYIAHIKAAVPPERLTVLKLEDGLGWDEVCAFTGDVQPAVDGTPVPYPKGTEHDSLVEVFQARLVKKALLNLAIFIVVPSTAVGLWWCFR